MTVMTAKSESQLLTSRARRRALARLRDEHQLEYEILYIAALQECRREMEEEQRLAALGIVKQRYEPVLENGICRPCLSRHHWRCRSTECRCSHTVHNGRPATDDG